jgi:alpha-D-xyloside xylohydrolase
LYEDEGDNYNYAQGMSAQIPVCWDNQLRTLTIDSRQGSYPGMPPSREFRLIIVGAGIAQSGNQQMTSFVYSGQKIVVTL